MYCRGLIAAEKRSKFLRARVHWLDELNRAGLIGEGAGRKRYSEKMLTLTVPHLPTDTVVERIERVFEVWSQFRRKLKKWFLERRIKRAHYYRMFEWTLGEADDVGNPHLHVWLLCPFLERDRLTLILRDALDTVGCGVDQRVLDIRAVKERGILSTTRWRISVSRPGYVLRPCGHCVAKARSPTSCRERGSSGCVVRTR